MPAQFIAQSSVSPVPLTAAVQPGPRPARSIALALAMIQIALVHHFMPLPAVFSQRMLSGLDYDLHAGQALRMSEALARWGHSWSYDVQLLAGQPEGTLGDLGAKGWELWTFALSSLGVPQAIAFNSFALLVMLFGPCIAYALSRRFGLSVTTSLIAWALALCLWFFDSYLHWLWFSGAVGGVAGSCLAVFALSEFQRWLRAPQLGSWLALATSMSLAILCHPAACITLFSLGCAWGPSARQLSKQQRWATACLPLVALIANAYWLANAFEHRHVALGHIAPQAWPNALVCDALGLLCDSHDTGLIGTRTGFRLLTLLLAAAGILVLRRERDPLAARLGWSLSALLALGYAGRYVPVLRELESTQQLVTAMLLTTMPAAEFVRRTIQQLRDVGLPQRARAGAWILSLLLARQFASDQLPYFLPSLAPEPWAYPDGTRPPLSQYGYILLPPLPSDVRFALADPRRSIDPGVESVIQWLRDHARPGARMLVQGSALAERLAWREHFEVLGGARERRLDHVDSDYFYRARTEPKLADSLADYLQHFAVEWVVGDRPEFRKQRNLLRLVGTVEGTRIYANKSPVSRMLHGSGDVRASTNRIEVHGSPPSEPLLLSYHWHPALRCKPNCRVVHIQFPIDRVGLIMVPAPHPTDFVVWNSYEQP